MKAQIKLARVFGVELGLHYSWFIIAALIAFSLGAHFRAVNAGWGNGVIWTAAIVTAVLFFVCLFAHELSHAAVAKSRGLPIHRITLFLLGGMAQIEKEATDASTEFWMGIAGPIASAIIGIILLAIAWASGWVASYRPSDTGYCNPGMARLHQSCACCVQYDPGVPAGRRASTAGHHLVAHEKCDQGHQYRRHHRADRWRAFHSLRNRSILFRRRLWRHLDGIHWLVPVTGCGRDPYANASGKPAAWTARSGSNDE